MLTMDQIIGQLFSRLCLDAFHTSGGVFPVTSPLTPLPPLVMPSPTADGSRSTYVRPKGDTSIVSSTAAQGMGRASRVELVMRSIRVFYAAARLFGDYKLVQYRSDRMPDGDDEGVNVIWDAAHERNSRFLYRKFVGLEGLWVKLGQYLSSRADFMPEPFITHLGKCQDSIPARPWGDVRAQIERELGRPIKEMFSSIKEQPIACASIAQVHKAVLIDGTDGDIPLPCPFRPHPRPHQPQG